jgi:hypothetical protein
MSDSFAPLATPALAAEESAFAPFALKLFRGASTATPVDAPKPSGPETSPSPACAPVITLQRNGDVISAIRVQCSCGQIIELNCLYAQSDTK